MIGFGLMKTVRDTTKHQSEVSEPCDSWLQCPSSGLANTAKHQPEFIRLPKSGQRCPHTGLSRSALNELILPNLGKSIPLVRSVLVRKRGAMRGIRLIDYDSLLTYLNSYDENGKEVVS